MLQSETHKKTFNVKPIVPDVKGNAVFSFVIYQTKSNFKFLQLQFAFEYDECLTGQESLSKVNLSKMKERIFFVCLSNDDARLTDNEVSFEGKENFEGSIFLN